MTKKEALKVIGCSWSTLRRYVIRGLIHATVLQNGKKNYWDDDVYAMVGKRIPREHLIAIYCRVNGKSREANDKMLEQKRIIYGWCAKRGIIIDRVYEERGLSTEYSKERRPVLHELMKDIFSKKIDAVVIETEDRISRVGYPIFREMFKYHGVEPIVINKVIEDPFYQSEQAADIARILEQAKIDRLGDIKKDSK